MAERKIRELVVHHSASPRETTTIGKIKQWHKDRGWDHVGYHHIILSNGVVAATLSHNKEGYHVYGKNADSIGICVVGNFSNELPTPNQVEGLKRKLLKLCKKYGLYSWNVHGHCEIAFPDHATQCPGIYFLPKLDEIRFWLMKELREDEKKGEEEKRKKVKEIQEAVPITLEALEKSFTFWGRVRLEFEKIKSWIYRQYIEKRWEKWTNS